MSEQSSIETKISADRSATIAISGEAGGLDIRDMAQLFEVAKFMSLSRAAIPAYLQGNPWDCLAIILQAREWRMSPYAVARMSYLTEGRNGEKQIAYMSQIIHAVVEARAPIKGRLRVTYEGEGDDRACIVSATLLDGEIKEHKSPRLGDRRPRPQEKTNRQTGEKYTSTAGSPLWQTKPDVQLFYDTSRDFVRIFFPDVIMGVYSDDELAEAGFEEVPAKDLARMPAKAQMAIEESLSTRLSPSAAKRAGFDVAAVGAEIEKAKNGEGASGHVTAVRIPNAKQNEPAGPPPAEAAETDAPQRASPAPVSSAATNTNATAEEGQSRSGNGGLHPTAGVDTENAVPTVHPVIIPEAAGTAPGQHPLDAAGAPHGDGPTEAEIERSQGRIGAILAAADAEISNSPHEPSGAPDAARLAVPPAKPTDDASYRAWVTHWGKQAKTLAETQKRWNDERKLRRECNVTSETVGVCSSFLTQAWKKESASENAAN